MPVPREGFLDTLQSSRLTWLTGTAYPAAPVGVFLGLYGGVVPASDGTGGNEITSSGRPAVTFGAPVADGSLRWVMANTNTPSFTVPASGVPAGLCVGFGIYSAMTAGTLNFWGYLPSPFPFAPGQVLTIPIGALRVYSERVVM